MIFSETWQQVLAGVKTQTCRLCYAGDELGAHESGELAVLEAAWPGQKGPRRARWIVGRTYAVQRERCHPAVGRIRVTGLRRVEDFTIAAQDPAFARAEGFDSPEACLTTWHKLHPGDKAHQAVWAIRFVLEGDE